MKNNYNKQKHRKSLINYNKHPKRCKFCNKQIPYEKRINNFCNSSCFASLNNIGKCRNRKYYDDIRGYTKPIKKNKILNIKSANYKFCKFCGSLLPSNSLTFCNRRCNAFFNTKVRIENNQVTCTTKRSFKKYLIYIRGHQCEDCHIMTWKNTQIPLEIHHIDGNIHNMNENNILLLCPNCHTFTCTYKSKNTITNHQLRRE